MARNKTTVRKTVKRSVVEPDIETVETTEINGDDADKLASIIEALSDAPLDDKWTIDVYGVEKGQQPEFFWRLPASDIATVRERCRDEVGTGTYRVIVRENEIIRRCGNFRVRRLGAPPAAVVAAAGPDRFEQILLAMKQQSEALIALVMRPVAAAPTAAMSLKEMVETMVQLKSMTTEGGAQTGMSLFMDGVKFAKELNVSDREPGLLESLLQSPIVGKILEGAVAAQARAAAPLMTAALPSPVSDRPAPVREAPEDDAFLAQLRFLVSRARVDDDPQLYAFVVRDVLAASELAYVRAIVRQAGSAVLPQLINAIPEIGQYRAWFSDLLDRVPQIMADDESLPASEGLDAGDAPTAEGSTLQAS